MSDIKFIDADSKSFESIEEEVRKCWNEACVIHCIGTEDVTSLASVLVKGTDRNVNWQFSTITPKVGDVFLIDKNHEILYDGEQISRRVKAKKSHHYDFQSIIENSLNEIYIFNTTDLKFEFVNQGALDNLGHTLEEMQQMQALDIKPFMTRQAFFDYLNPLKDGLEEKVTYETVHRRANGTDYPVEVRLQIMEQNDTPFFVAIVLDISELKNTLFKNIEVTSKLINLASNFPNGSISLIDADFQVIFTEGESYKKHRINPETLLGVPLKDAVFAPIYDNFKSVIKRLKKNKSTDYIAEFEGSFYQCIVKEIRDEKDLFLYYILRVVDVTSIHDKDEKILLEKNKYATIYKAINDSALVSITDNQGIIVHVNNEFCLVSKYAEAELVGQDHNIINSGHHPKSFWTEMWKTVTNGKTWRAEVKNKAKDGSFYWVDTVINPLFDIEGNIDRFLSIRYLSTERKTLKHEQIALKDKLSLATQAAKMGVWTYDVESHKIFWNDKMLDIYGVKTFDGAFETFASLIHEKDREQQLKAISSYMEDESISEYEVQHQVNTDNAHEVFIKGRALIERKNGIAKKLTGVVWDITEERKKEVYLSQLTNKLQLATKAAKLGIWTWHLESGEVIWDEAMKTLFGREEFDSTIASFAEFIHPEDREDLFKEVDAQLMKHQGFNYTFRIIKSNGDVAFIRAMASLEAVDGKQLLIGVNLDVTAEKEAAEQLTLLNHKYELANGISKIGIWSLDLKNDRLEWDDRTKDNFEVETFDNQLDDFIHLIHPDDAEHMKNDLQFALENSDYHDIHFRIITPKNKIKYIHSKAIIERRAGVATKMIGVNIDNTKTEIARLEIDNLRLKYELALKGSNDGFFDTDLERDQSFHSDRFFEMLGIEGLKNNQKRDFWVSLLHEDDKERVLNEVKGHIESDVPLYEVESRLIHSDGHAVPTLVRAYVSKNESGVTIRVTGTIMDLTTIKEAEMAIKESEAKHRFLVESSQEIISIHEPNGKYKFISPSIFRLTGYKPEELLGKDPFSLVHLDDVTKVMQESRIPAFSGKAVSNIQYRFRKKDGTYIWLNSYTDIVKNESGQVISFHSGSRDISEMKAAEQKTKESEEMLRNIADNIPGIIWRYVRNPEGTDAMEYISKGAETIWEIPREELLINMKPLWEQIHPDDLLGFKTTVEESAEHLTLWKYDYRIVLPGGRIKWLSAHGQAKKLDKGRIMWHSIALDITAKREAEIKLAESEEMLSNIADSIPGAIWRYNLYPDGTDAIDYLSRAAANIWELPIEELSTNMRPLWEMIHPEDITEVAKSIEISSQNMTAWKCEYRIIMADGRIKWLSTAGQPRKLSNGGISWHSMALDITDKKNAEIELALSEEMLSDVTNNLPGLILRYVILPDGTDQIEFISEGCLDLWEISKQDALVDINKVWAKVHPSDLEEFLNSIDKSAATLSLWKAEWRFVMDDGSIKWVSGTGQPKKLADGAILWHTLQLDITDKKNAEIELEKTLKQLNLSIETGKMGIWELNVANGYLDWNEQMFEIFGVEKSSFDYHVDTFNKLVHPEDTPFTNNELGKIAQGNTVNKLQFRIVRPDGQIRHVLTSGNPSSFNENGEVEKFIGVNIDVTHIAEYQKQLEAALREKDALFKELHHRIKNNLQMVSSLLFIKSNMTEDISLKQFIDETSAKIHSISAIHEQLLQMQGVSQLDIKGYLESLCLNLVKTYSYNHTSYDLKMNLDSAIMEIDLVLSVGLIVNEIISNTMKYAYPEVGSGKIHVVLKNKTNESVLSVSDEGVGIPDEKISSIGKSYGMQLISLFTEQIGGTLSIENTKGTKFTIKFPTHV